MTTIVILVADAQEAGSNTSDTFRDLDPLEGVIQPQAFSAISKVLLLGMCF
jgi:putative alpha-1,2-mannosidase